MYIIVKLGLILLCHFPLMRLLQSFFLLHLTLAYMSIILLKADLNFSELFIFLYGNYLRWGMLSILSTSMQQF